jgi:hypothetical protein
MLTSRELVRTQEAVTSLSRRSSSSIQSDMRSSASGSTIALAGPTFDTDAPTARH